MRGAGGGGAKANAGFPVVCGLVHLHTDTNPSLSALMMCASAGPLQAQRDPVDQHSCPGCRPITQCQCSPPCLSVCLLNCGTVPETEGGADQLGNNCYLTHNYQDICSVLSFPHIFNNLKNTKICIMNKCIMKKILHKTMH